MTQFYYDIWAAITVLTLMWMLALVNFTGSGSAYVKLFLWILVFSGIICIAWRILS